MTALKVNQDEYLLKQVSLGDSSAFGELYNRYWDTAYAQAYKRLQDEDKAKDIVQEIFVNIWLRRRYLITNFQAYLRISIRNQVIKLITKEKHIDYFFEHLPDIPSVYAQADANIKSAEFYTSYRQLVSALPPKRRMIFKLRHHDDLSTKVIAAELGLSLKTVQNQLGKAVEQLKIPMRQLL